MTLLEQLKDEMKNAMRAKDKIRLTAIRMALSAIKQAEIDNKTETTDESIIAVLTKMVKQRKESIAMFKDGGRDDMAEKEAEEEQEDGRQARGAVRLFHHHHHDGHGFRQQLLGGEGQWRAQGTLCCLPQHARSC